MDIDAPSPAFRRSLLDENMYTSHPAAGMRSGPPSFNRAVEPPSRGTDGRTEHWKLSRRPHAAACRPLRTDCCCLAQTTRGTTERVCERFQASPLPYASHALSKAVSLDRTRLHAPHVGTIGFHEAFSMNGVRRFFQRKSASRSLVTTLHARGK